MYVGNYSSQGPYGSQLLSSRSIENRATEIQKQDSRDFAAQRAADSPFNARTGGLQGIGLSNEMFAVFGRLEDFDTLFGGLDIDSGPSNLLDDIRSDMGETDEFINELGLNAKDKKAVNDARDALLKKIDEVEKAAGGKPLTEAQIKEIEKAEDAFFDTVDKVAGIPEITPEQEKALSKAEETYAKAVDAIFKEAGNKPLTAEQEKRLAAAEEKYDKALDAVFGPPLSEAQEKRLDKALSQYEKLTDQAFKRLGNKELSEGEFKTLEKLEDRFFKRLDGLFNKAGPVSKEDEKALAQAEKALQSSLDKLVARAKA